MIIYVEFPVLHWHFELVLNVFVMTTRATMTVYMFHSHQFHSPVMSPFFCPHELYEDIHLDDVQPPFHPSMYPIDGEADSDIHLTQTYLVKSNLSNPTFPSMIWLTSDCSLSAASRAPPTRCEQDFIRTRAAPPTRCEQDFIRTRAAPRGWGQASGGRHGDAPGGSENGFVSFWGWGMMWDSIYGAWMRASLFLFIVLGLSFYGIFGLWRIFMYFLLVGIWTSFSYGFFFFFGVDCS